MTPAPPGPAQPARILVVGPAWVGDMVMAECLFAALKRRYPAARLEVLAPRWTLPLLQFMPAVDEGILLPFGHGELKLGERRRLGRSLRTRGYDLAFVLPGSLKAALVPYWSGASRRRGYGGALRRLLLTEAVDKPELPQVESFQALMDSRLRGNDKEGLGEFGSEESRRPKLVVPSLAIEAALAALGLARPASPLLAIAPGAEYGPAKRWPARHFAELAATKRRAGWTVWLFGSARDREITAAIANDADLAGRTSLDQAVTLLALADAVVSNDSGLMHVAAALGRPQVALFGPSDALRTGPRNPEARVLRLGLDCSPCNKRVCPLGHHRCLEDLTPAQALAALPPP
jgi:heptosyltransferase-2